MATENDLDYQESPYANKMLPHGNTHHNAHEHRIPEGFDARLVNAYIDAEDILNVFKGLGVLDLDVMIDWASDLRDELITAQRRQRGWDELAGQVVK